MQKFRVYSKLLSGLSRIPLEHDPLKSTPCTAMLHSSYARFKPKFHRWRKLACDSSFYHKTNSGPIIDEMNLDDSSDCQYSTAANDENILSMLLKEIVDQKTIGTRTGFADGKIKTLCDTYKCMPEEHKQNFILTLANQYAIKHEYVTQCANTVAGFSEDNPAKLAKCEEILRAALTPQYSFFFKHIGRLEGGVKFLVDFRSDILNLLTESDSTCTDSVVLQQLNVSLRELLSLWFSVGFLKLELVTWQSSCDMLQKISEYEAVHPVRSWADIKRRVGPYRRCFVFLHNSMPDEPLVVLHTALCDEIPASLAGLVSARSRMSVDSSPEGISRKSEDPSSVKAAVFYSITSTQRGLQGIDLGNYLIKKVVRELQTEFPQMAQFSTLSPIPGFKLWLLEKIKAVERDRVTLFTEEEISALRGKIDGDFWPEVMKIIKKNSWVDSALLTSILSVPIMRLCAKYLYLEKRRGFALCSVGNFHLSNGAVMWRINWRADLSLRGLTNSCGIMVNYRYFLEDAESNSEQYLGKQKITVSDNVLNLATSHPALHPISKM